MEEKRVTISDIAQELGLSTATVSNVLHGKTKKVSDRTVQKVQALLEERQYIPSMAGILLARNDSKIIGVVVNDHEKYEAHTLEDVFIASSLNHLSAEIEKRNQFMMVKKTRDTEEIIRFASMWNLDGLVLLGFCRQDFTYLRNHMRIPFVVYDGYFETSHRIYNITIDNYNGGHQVGAFFRQTGHCRALCISDNQDCMDKERYEGFREGLYPGIGDFMLIPMKKTLRRQFYLEHLNALRSYSAVFAVSDYYALDLMHFLKEQGISVPGDISVAGFDDTPLCTLVSPTLTSVKQDVSLRARIALDALHALKKKQNVEPGIMLPVTLIERDSTRSTAGSR
jgi:LacI family transcriptional regulator